jgi:hypothetical protein
MIQVGWGVVSDVISGLHLDSILGTCRCNGGFYGLHTFLLCLGGLFVRLFLFLFLVVGGLEAHLIAFLLGSL